MTSIGSRIIAIGAVSAGLAVAVGAFGAHALEDRVEADMLANYETGARYHFYHSLGLIGIGLFALIIGEHGGTTGDRPADLAGTENRPGHRGLRWSAALMLTGIVLFSGSLYTMALTNLRWLGAITPLGGVAFLVAWALFARAALER